MENELPIEKAQHLFSILAAFLLAWGALLCARKLGFFNWPKKPAPPSFLNLKDCIQLFCLFITTQIFILPFTLYFFFIKGHEESRLNAFYMGWINILAIVMMAGILGIFFYFKWWKVKPLLLSDNIKSDIAIGLLSWLVAFPCAVAISQIIVFFLQDIIGFVLDDQTAVLQVKENLKYPVLFAASAFSVVFIVPVLEEIIFRGFLQTALKSFITPFQAIFFSAALFSFFHFSISQGVNNFNILITLFVLALFLGWVRERQGNLWPAIALHSLFNAVSVAMIGFQS